MCDPVPDGDAYSCLLSGRPVIGPWVTQATKIVRYTQAVVGSYVCTDGCDLFGLLLDSGGSRKKL